jgi:hypothetical protein
MQSYIGPISVSRDNVNSATMMPSILVNPHQDEIASLVVPYVYPYTFMDITKQNLQDLGHIRIYVFSTLRAVNQQTLPSVPWTLYAKMVDPVVTGFTAKPLHLEPALIALEEQSLNGDSASRVVPEALNLFSTDASDTAVSAGVHGYPNPNNSNKEIGLNPSEMEFSHIYTRANPHRTSTWVSTEQAGFKMNEWFVCPHDYPNLRVEASSPATFLTTLSSVHKFWRGALRYRIQFFASAFHSGRILLAWHPAGDPPGTVDISDLSNTNHIIIDLQQSTDLFFEVPYLYPLPWQRTVFKNNYLPAVMTMTVLNPLTTPSGEISVVDYVVWVYGSSSLEFALPYTQTNADRIGAMGDPAQPRTQEIELEEQCQSFPLDDPKFGTLAAAGPIPDDACMGEKITNVYDACRKIACIGTYTLAAGNRAGSYQSIFARTSITDEQRVALKVFQRMYLTSRGPVRYAATAVTGTSLSNLANYEVPFYMGFFMSDAPEGIALTSAPSPVPPFGSLLVKPNACPNSAIVVPYYCNALFLLHYAALQTPLDDEYPHAMVQYQLSDGLAFVQTRYYASPAPGFELGYLVAPLWNYG